MYACHTCKCVYICVCMYVCIDMFARVDKYVYVCCVLVSVPVNWMSVLSFLSTNSDVCAYLCIVCIVCTYVSCAWVWGWAGVV